MCVTTFEQKILGPNFNITGIISKCKNIRKQKEKNYTITKLHLQ